VSGAQARDSHGTSRGPTIPAFVYHPPADRFPGRRPVYISIHGGPEEQTRPNFRGSNNYFIDEMGVALIYPNVRGSSGYGKT
jgi:dipeptidyl aminopeptidase/acylaminoacyl peptidase